MKYAIIILGFCLVVSTFTLSSTIRALNKISASPFGKTLIDTIQIELRTSTGADPRPRISQLLGEIRDETQRALEALDRNINDRRADCQNTQGTLTSSINELNRQIEADTKELGAAHANKRELEGEIDRKTGLRDDYQSQLDHETESRNKNQQDFERSSARLRTILSTLEKTRTFITDRLEQRNAAPSFLQRNNVLVEIKQTVSSPEFMSLSSGYGKFISFLATKALNHLRQTPDDEAKAGLNRIVSIINGLASNVNEQLTTSNLQNEQDKARYESEKGRLENLISTLNAALSSLGIELANLNSRITELGSAIETNGNFKTQKTQELNDNIALCKEAERVYAETFAQRTQELGIIDDVIKILNEDLSNLRKYGEDVITSSSIDV